MAIVAILLVGCIAFHSTTTHMAQSSPDDALTSFTAQNLDESSSLCPLKTGELRSLEVPSARKTITQFHNSAGDVANIMWYDHLGNPSFKAAIPTNGYYATLTWEGHAFRVWNKDFTTVLLDFRVGRKSFGYALDRNMSTDRTSPSVDGDVEADLPNLDWEKAREVGFVNRMKVELDLYFVDEKEEERLLLTLVPGDVYYEITYHMHKFRARFHGDESRTIVKEVVIGDIEIPPCELTKRRKNTELKEPEKTNVKETRNETYREDEMLTKAIFKEEGQEKDVVILALTMTNSSSFFAISI